jgi:hypothetical protein
MPAMILSETLFTFLLTLAIWLFLKDIQYYFIINNQAKRKTLGLIGYPILAGFLFGMTALTRSTGFTIPFLLIGYFMLRLIIVKFIRKPSEVPVLAQRNLSHYLIYPLLFLITFSLVQTPWIIKNYRITNRLILNSTSAGITFFCHNTNVFKVPGSNYLSPDTKLNDIKRYSDQFSLLLVTPKVLHPALLKLRHTYKQEKRNPFNESLVSKYFMAEGWKYLRTLSWTQIIRLELTKLYHLVQPYHPFHNPIPDFTFIIILPFFLYGIYLFFHKRHQKDLWSYKIEIFWLLLGYLIAVTLAFGGLPRYRDPYDPYIIIIAVITALELFKRFYGKKPTI